MALTKEQWNLINKSCKKLKKYLDDGFSVYLDGEQCVDIYQDSGSKDNPTWYFDSNDVDDGQNCISVIYFEKETNSSFEQTVKNINSFKIYQTKEIKNKAIIFMEPK